MSKALNATYGSLLTKNERDFLRSLLRMQIRSQERGLAKAQRKSEQSEADFMVFKTHLEERLEFAKATLAKLQLRDANPAEGS